MQIDWLKNNWIDTSIKVQMTKIYISVSPLQLSRHYFKDHTTENRMQKFQLVPEI